MSKETDFEKIHKYYKNRIKKIREENKELRETLLKKLMVNLNNTNELSTDMLYKLTDVFEMDAIEIFKEIKHLNNKP